MSDPGRPTDAEEAAPPTDHSIGPSIIRLGCLAAVVALGYAVSLSVNLPGHFEPDSLWQLAQGRTGVYNNWHPPVMAWLLGLAVRFDPHAPLFIVFSEALFFSGLAAFACLEPRPRLIVLPIVALMMASPLVLIYQGVVWKDVLFANASVAGFAALAWAGRMWPRPPLRYALLVVALVLVSLAGLTRQNGVIIPICASVGLVAMRLFDRSAGSTVAARARAAGYGALGLALSVTIMAGATAALDAHGDGEPENLNQLKRLQVYDLAGMTRLDPAIDLPVLHSRAPDVERFIRTQAAPHFDVTSADNLEALPGADDYLIPEGDGASRQWTALILARPDLYLRTRAAVFAMTLLSPSSACRSVFVGVTGEDPALLREAGLAVRFNQRDRWDAHYAIAFLGTPVFSHLFYAGVLIVVMALAARDISRGDRRSDVIIVLAMGAAAILFLASFFIASYACDYRYLYFLDVAAMAALLRHVARRPLARTKASGRP